LRHQITIVQGIYLLRKTKALFIYKKRVYRINKMETQRPLPRITGTEMEWGGMVADKDDLVHLRLVDGIELLPAIRRYLHAEGIAKIGIDTNYYLGNGARFYQDVNQRREYATPEDDSFIGTTANEIAGDKIMHGVAEAYRKTTGNSISFTKRVIDDNFVGCGYHVSYAGDAKKVSIKEGDLSLFGVFAATRGVLFGAGALMPGGIFAVAQKGLAINADFSTGTTQTKPVVNLRNEQHADQQHFIRLHDTSGDPNMSPWATRVKLGAGSLVLRLIEHGRNLESLRFDNKLQNVVNDVSMDSKLIERFKLANNMGSVSALEAQQRIAFQARLLSREIVLGAEELWALDEWEKAIADLMQDPRLTVDRIEWTMRQAILSRLHNKHGWAWDSERLRYKDRQFSEVALDGIALALQETAWAKYMPPESLINERVKNAPSTTRAHIRGAFIKQMQKRRSKQQASVDWAWVRYNDKPYLLPNPYATESPAITELLAS
jgi:hypothetical protein